MKKFIFGNIYVDKILNRLPRDNHKQSQNAYMIHVRVSSTIDGEFGDIIFSFEPQSSDLPAEKVVQLLILNVFDGIFV